jgi:hypothetical protein
MPVSLDDVPLDAPYRGDGPLYEWDAAAQAWVSFRGVRLVRESDRPEGSDK